jgi:hypothetical protein
MMKHNHACDHCGRRFGLVTHRWWGGKFCSRACKQIRRRDAALWHRVFSWHGDMPRLQGTTGRSGR